ncbi:MAG: HAMP domain-containing protein [Oligoflexia bacterium]|nr:HAMP domain-containing protein [Oligoflexia bacterium]
MSIPHPRVRLTVGTKLVSLIAVLLISSIATLVYLSTRMFIEDNTALIQQTNADKASALSIQLRETFDSQTEKMRILGSLLLHGAGAEAVATPEQRQTVVREFFSKDKDFIGAFVFQRGPEGKFAVGAHALSPELPEGETADSLQGALASDPDFQTEQVGKGEVLITTARLQDGSTAIAVSIPFIQVAQGSGDGFTHTLTALLKQGRFLKVFAESDVVTSYLVDRKGRLLAHPDSARAAAAENVSSVEIVKQLLSGKFNNGQTSYLDPVSKEVKLGAFRTVGFAGLGVVTEVAEAKAFEAARRVGYRAMLIGAIVLSLAFLGGYLFSRTITWPIKLLMEASRKISEGDFKINLKPRGRDEVAHLSIAFNEMAMGLEERDKVKATFAKFHSKEVAEKVLSGELKLGGERNSAAVFFSDVRGFTAMSEKMDPESLVKILNRYMTRMVRVILSHGGIVDKYVGDAIMATWGVPIAKPGDVERALRACIEMRLVLNELNQELASEGLPPLRIGMGLNFGSLISGNIGSEERMEFTVIGDTVNTASRIESLTKEFGTDLLVSQDVLSQVPEMFIVEKAHETRVKGKTEPIAVYKVLGYYNERREPVLVQTPYSSYKAERSDKVIHDPQPAKPAAAKPQVMTPPRPAAIPPAPPAAPTGELTVTDLATKTPHELRAAALLAPSAASATRPSPLKGLRLPGAPKKTASPVPTPQAAKKIETPSKPSIIIPIRKSG